jgi:GTP-binding protein Era
LETEEPSTVKPKLWVRAFLVVERSSQVGILVGHKGEKIKAIRIGALREMKKVFPWKISLDLRVKVNPKWRKKDPLLKRMMGTGE